MPLTRYQIRNEFNLADPELYRAADKDDPEALLEGVAMAGFVGLLRQLGDLAEFAAEIFHDLHEEVMATAARGHALMARIQQLEADVPLIEKNLLSQTIHTTFYYNTGVDWHPQMRTDQNLITQGDMPRFIRDSYEECRGPPQLFLLDKFDIGGAGTCLKRYTDPSSFKVEPTVSDAAKIGVQRDRRTRKIKKKGSQWRNGGNPDVLATSHAKLHQLLLEERIGNESKDSTFHVKLKKRVPDSSKRYKSYMEKFLQTMSPDYSETDEIKAGEPILRLTYDQTDPSECEILDIQPVSAADDSHYFSHTGEEMKLRPSVMYSYDFSKSKRNRGSTVSIEDGNSFATASALHITNKDLSADGNNRNGNGISSPYYDATENEMESFMDALANVESEAETDNECIPKKELRYFSKHIDVYESKELVLDSQSFENSILSDDGSISFVKATSTSSSQTVPSKEEHDIREAESSISMNTHEAVVIDHSDSLDYDKKEKTTSNQYLNANGETVGSLVIPYNYEVGDVTFQKNSSRLLQSSDSGLSSRELTSAGAYNNIAPSELIYDSELPQLGRNRENGGATMTPDGPCMVDNVPVVGASIERDESNEPSEVLRPGSMNFRHDHSKSSSTIENETLEMGHVNEFSSETSVIKDVLSLSPQSVIETQLQDRDISSHLISPPNYNSDSFLDTVSNDDDARSASGECVDGLNHVMNTTEENDASVLCEGHSSDDDSLYTTKRELTATKSSSNTLDTEGHITSEEVLSHRVPGDGVSLETNSGSNHDYGQAVSPVSICLPSVNRNRDEDVIRQSDSITQRAGDLQTETDVNLEEAPPLPPLPRMQWMAVKPQEYLLDAEEESVQFSMGTNANGSLPPFAFGLEDSFHFTALNGEIKQPLKATETDESLLSTSSDYPSGFPLPTDSAPHVKDAIEENGQPCIPTSDNLRTDSSLIHSRERLESSQPDTAAVAREALVLSCGSCLPTSSTSTDAFTIEDVHSNVSAEFSVPTVGDWTADTKENIQPRPVEHTVLSAGESIQSGTTWESPQSSLGDTFANEFTSSQVPMLYPNRSPEELRSYGRTEHDTQGNEKEISNHPEVPGSLFIDEEQPKKEINLVKSSERQASWSLALQNYEGEKQTEKLAFKPPRPRNPLIPSADALDRSKLKKVTTLNRPKAPTVDERGSILEQIRAKSFNLKRAPAPVPKPIIQAPSMNLKVAAILEKANKIRRATAGSDEDDEDDWSDD